jgi:hypothetical protein
MAQTRQAWPDSGPGFQVKDLKNLYVVPSSLESGSEKKRCGHLMRLGEGAREVEEEQHGLQGYLAHKKPPPLLGLP